MLSKAVINTTFMLLDVLVSCCHSLVSEMRFSDAAYRGKAEVLSIGKSSLTRQGV